MQKHLLGLDTSDIDFESADVPMHRELVPHYFALVDDAKKAGFGLRAASGFRSFERQLAIWNAKLKGGRPVLDDKGEAIDLSCLSPKEQVFAVLRWSALPGASRHHWGTELDIYDAEALADKDLQLTLEETQENGPFYAMYCWLDNYLERENAVFSRPYLNDNGGIACEPWHLSFAELSSKYALQFDHDALKEIIQNAELCCKDVVLKHYDEIIERFVKNMGPVV